VAFRIDLVTVKQCDFPRVCYGTHDVGQRQSVRSQITKNRAKEV